MSDDCSAPRRGSPGCKRILDGDPRFVVSRSPRRLGYYHNFERALSMAPPSADVRRRSPTRTTAGTPRSSRRCSAPLGDANLVYSDARIVDRDGRAALRHLLVAASQQPHQPGLAPGCEHRHRRRFAVPPRAARPGAAVPAAPRLRTTTTTGWRWSRWRPGGSPTSTARSTTTSSIGGAALGHARANAAGVRVGARAAATARAPAPLDAGGAGARIYFWDVCRLLQFATVLERRCGDRMSREKAARACACWRAIERSPRAMAWLWLRRASELARPQRDARGRERAAPRHRVAACCSALIARRELPPAAVRAATRACHRARRARARPVTDHQRHADLADEGPPLELDIRADAPQRVNLLVPTIDLEHFFGGYIAKLNLARRLADRGLRVRLVTVDHDPAAAAVVAAHGRVLQRPRRALRPSWRSRSRARRGRSR